MRVEDSPEHQVGVKQVKTSVKHTSRKSMERWERKSTRVLQFDSKNHVEEVSAERSACTRTSQSCNQENIVVEQHQATGSAMEEYKERDEHWEVCKLEGADNIAVEELSIREHFENIDTSNASEFWDQVKLIFW